MVHSPLIRPAIYWGGSFGGGTLDIHESFCQDLLVSMNFEHISLEIFLKIPPFSKKKMVLQSKFQGATGSRVGNPSFPPFYAQLKHNQPTTFMKERNRSSGGRAGGGYVSGWIMTPWLLGLHGSSGLFLGPPKKVAFLEGKWDPGYFGW